MIRSATSGMLLLTLTWLIRTPFSCSLVIRVDDSWLLDFRLPSLIWIESEDFYDLLFLYLVELTMSIRKIVSVQVQLIDLLPNLSNLYLKFHVAINILFSSVCQIWGISKPLYVLFLVMSLTN